MTIGSPAGAKGFSPTIALVFLGLLAGIQSADPGIASTALISAGKDLVFGGLDGLAASVSTLVLAATVISTGMLADRLGRKKIISLAMVLAIVGDVTVSLAQNPWMFIAGRAITGIALGTVFGAAFAYVQYFGAKGKGGVAGALGIFGASTGLFTLLIIFSGSSLVGVGWRVAFLLVPALNVLTLIIGLFLLPKDTKAVKDGTPWDALGQVLLGLAVVSTLYGIAHASDSIVSPLTIGPVVFGLILFVLFYFRERNNSDRRFFPIALLKQPLFLAAIGVGFLVNFTSGLSFLSFNNVFQYQLDLSGLSLSLSQLPFIVVGIPSALIVGRILSKQIMSRQMSAFVGSLFAAGGALTFALTALAGPTSVWDYLPALILLGMGTVIPSVAYGGMILQEADPKHYGVVSSSRTTIGQFWYSLGLAVSAVVIDSIARAHVAAKLGSTGSQQIDAWAASGAKPSDSSVLPTAVEGFVQGFAVAMIALAILAVVVGIVVLILGNRADKLSARASTTPTSSTQK